MHSLSVPKQTTMYILICSPTDLLECEFRLIGYLAGLSHLVVRYSILVRMWLGPGIVTEGTLVVRGPKPWVQSAQILVCG